MDVIGRVGKIFLSLILLLLILSVLFVSRVRAAPMEHHGHDAGAMERLGALHGRDFDVGFYSMMIAHHQGAVDMARKVEDTTRDTKVRRWAKDIIRTQSQEIQTMQRAVDKLGGVDKKFYDAMDGDMRGMVEETRNDRDFVRLMIPHHESAIDMAELAKKNTKNAEILSLSDAIIKEQSREIAEFRKWLEK